MPDAILDDLMFLDLLGVPPVIEAHSDRRRKRRRRATPLLVRSREAARLASVSVSTWRRWTSLGLTPPAVKVGKVTLWSMRKLKLWDEWDCPPRAEFERRLQDAAGSAPPSDVS